MNTPAQNFPYKIISFPCHPQGPASYPVWCCGNSVQLEFPKVPQALCNTLGHAGQH